MCAIAKHNLIYRDGKEKKITRTGGEALKETAEIAAAVSIHNVCSGFLRGLCTVMRAFYWAYLDLRIHAVMLSRNFSYYDAVLSLLGELPRGLCYDPFHPSYHAGLAKVSEKDVLVILRNVLLSS